jgi:hypothetical protein
MFSRQSDGPKKMVVLFHRWWDAAFGVPGFTEKTSRQRVLTSHQETSSELLPYMMYNFLRCSSPPPGLRVGLVEETLKVLVWGLVPQLPLCHSYIGIGDLLLAGLPWRGGGILGVLVAPLTEALRKFLDLAALGGAVASPRMNRA